MLSGVLGMPAFLSEYAFAAVLCLFVPVLGVGCVPTLILTMVTNRPTCLHCRAAIALAVLLSAMMAAETAEAVVVSGTGVTNIQAPISLEHVTWSNVGVVGAGTGIYLGNSWVLTAHHIGGGAITLTNGATYQMAAGTGRQLRNPDDNTLTDLYLYQLTADPGLPSVSLASEFGMNDFVMMVGSGKQRGDRAFWSVATSTTPWTWTPVTSGSSTIDGYSLLQDRAMSWGLNFIADSQPVSIGGLRVSSVTTEFRTAFSGEGQAGREGQATVGDSGGPVFRQNEESLWELAGIIVGASHLSGQPDAVLLGHTSSDFYSETYIADLTVYRDQIVTITAVPEPGTVGLAVAAAATGILGRGLRRRRAG